jgi:hypothetical protein
MATPFVYRRSYFFCGREVVSVAARIQALLIVLGAVVAAALNGASPWGP